MMDYIYKDAEGKKHVGEIEYIEVSPDYLFVIRTEKTVYNCDMRMLGDEWELFLHYTDGHRKQVEDKSIALSYPADVIWNIESIYNEIDDVEESWKIAYALKSIFEKYHYKDVSY